MRVLVVDDDAVFREELAQLLNDDGHRAVAASSVAKALELLEHDEFDAVLTDLKMPRHGGLELLQTVRRRWPRTFVVVVTGFATVETALEAMKLGAFDYVRKPFRLDQLRETLRLVEQERAFGSPPDAARDAVREAEALAATGRYEVLLLAGSLLSSAPHLAAERFDPDHPERLGARCLEFIGEHPNAAIVLVGVERLLDRHRLEDVAALLDRIRAALAGHGPLRVGFDPRRLAPSSASTLSGIVTTAETHAALEALANPIRRKILQRLEQAPASFGEVMQAVGIEDSPKLAFHVRRLVETGLVAHDGELYRLTARGTAGARLLFEAMFLPPASEAVNLAFPDPRSP